MTELLDLALQLAKRGADKAGCDGWRANEMCRQIVPLLEAAISAKVDHGAETEDELRDGLQDCWGSLNFILAFYDPNQRYLDTEAWKQAEASGRRSHANAARILGIKQ